MFRWQAKLTGQDDRDKVLKDVSGFPNNTSPFLSARRADMEYRVAKTYNKLAKKIDGKYQKFENAYGNLIMADKEIKRLEGITAETINDKRMYRDMMNRKATVINDLNYLEGLIKSTVAKFRAKAQYQEAKVNAVIGAYFEGANIGFPGMDKPLYTVEGNYYNSFMEAHAALGEFEKYKEGN